MTVNGIEIVSFDVKDVRFPTSLDKTGSDAMNDAGDYSAAYVILRTNTADLTGHGMTFTIGRGNDVVCLAIKNVAHRLKGKKLADLTADMGATWTYLVADSQLRWIGPEKGVIHLALGAVVNALWDLWARSVHKPLWKLVADFTAEEYVRCIDFRYITDSITPAEAIELLEQASDGKQDRIRHAENNHAVQAYTTSAGWLGYGDEKLKSLLRHAVGQGFKYFKLKVGGNVDDDIRRLTIARQILGYDKGNYLMVDANQVWSVPDAINHMKQLAVFKPWFIEEPTSPDDVLGHLEIKTALKHHDIKVATGEMCQNRVVFKQFLKSAAIDICQIDACRIGGVNEVLAVLLLAKKYNVPIVPHSGGVGLPEYTQHLSTIDYVVVSGKPGLLEYIDTLHDKFYYPTKIDNGFFVTPTQEGYSVEMKPSAWNEFTYPEGNFWQSDAAAPIVLQNYK
ncbi:L-galactonate dehydratase [Lipomyces japonicus]|uniref:L-galactonate dehydratase n=1 Tax=Lipomyces japonicus TaxID=56871 RepID=UPI0034CD22DE